MEGPEALLYSLRISTPPRSPQPHEVHGELYDGHGSPHVSSTTFEEDDEAVSPVSSTTETRRSLRLWSDSTCGDEGVCDTTADLFFESPASTRPRDDPPPYSYHNYRDDDAIPEPGPSHYNSHYQPITPDWLSYSTAPSSGEFFVPPPQMPPPYSPLPDLGNYSFQDFLGAALASQLNAFQNEFGYAPPPYSPPLYAETFLGPPAGAGLDESFLLPQQPIFPSIPPTHFQPPLGYPPICFPPLEPPVPSFGNPFMLPFPFPTMMPFFEEIYPAVPPVVQPPQPPMMPNFVRRPTYMSQPLVPPAPRTPLAQVRCSRPLNPYSTPFVPKSPWSQGNPAPTGSSARQQSLLGTAPVHYRLDPPLQPLYLAQPPLADEKLLPYVSSVWDPNVMGSFKPAPEFAYYVPPRVDDNDYFGGQIRIWQDKIITTFQTYLPDVWTLQGRPHFNPNVDQNWYFFTITCKLRFCCRKCCRPWTSMRGKIHFAYNLIPGKGTIWMKIFGQVCNHDHCADQSFQTAACYPEEIQRVLVKLSEYIGYTHYALPLSSTFYTEPDKASREGNPRSPHRPALCQACHQGICSRRT